MGKDRRRSRLRAMANPTDVTQRRPEVDATRPASTAAEHRRLWIALLAIMVVSFAVLGFYGREIYREAPPVPDRVVTSSGELLFTGQQILDGQNVWQSTGGQELGSVWGHGAYTAPDWTADWLHREAVQLAETEAMRAPGSSFATLSEEDRASIVARIRLRMRANTYEPRTGILTVSHARAEAMDVVAQHYKGLFGGDPELAELREAYAMPARAVSDPDRLEALTAFFFWASWACVTERPGESITYTNNWPPERLVGNEPTGALLLWTGFSVILLLGGIGVLAWYYASHRDESSSDLMPEQDPLLGLTSTPSMRSTEKYFWVVLGLMLVQIMMGIVTAHYGVEGSGFYGFPLAEWLPYSVSRTWHVQLGILWIATSWLATGLFIGPAIGNREPRFQRLGVNVLFVALLVVVLGSMAGEWVGVMQMLGLEANFWFGHQGYEYVDLGRFWQILLLVGLFLWLFLLTRSIWPALQRRDDSRHLLILFVISSAAIAGFYAAGLMWGRQTNLAVAEYWRWWVVHLWVEGFFEVFATVVIAFLFVRMGLLTTAVATPAVLFSTSVFLAGGILGTFHHLYFTGTPTAILAIGATFSALEVVPLVLIGFEAYHNLSLSRARAWVGAYRWPIYCFIAVAFWNFLGAGIFGFLINPPIALYYMQGLNTTAVHGHTALFGVYGMLGIGLMLFVLKGLAARHVWKNGVIRFAFWSINLGLLLMVLLSVLPVGLAQTVVSVREGLWYARSAEFLQTGILDTFRWLRVVGDTLFAVGVAALAYFVVGLKTGWSLEREQDITLDGHPRTESTDGGAHAGAQR